jgi:hypothetical protein
MMKVIIVFSSFANAPENLTDHIKINVFFLWLFRVSHSPETRSLQGYYIECSNNSSSTLRDKLSVPKRL